MNTTSGIDMEQAVEATLQGIATTSFDSTDTDEFGLSYSRLSKEFIMVWFLMMDGSNYGSVL